MAHYKRKNSGAKRQWRRNNYSVPGIYNCYAGYSGFKVNVRGKLREDLLEQLRDLDDPDWDDLPERDEVLSEEMWNEIQEIRKKQLANPPEWLKKLKEKRNGE